MNKNWGPTGLYDLAKYPNVFHGFFLGMFVRLVDNFGHKDLILFLYIMMIY